MHVERLMRSYRRRRRCRLPLLLLLLGYDDQHISELSRRATKRPTDQAAALLEIAAFVRARAHGQPMEFNFNDVQSARVR